MSIALMTAVWKLDLQPSDKMVLLALADAANDDGVTWMAVKSRNAARADLLTKCSLSERAVQGAIKRLCADGHLTREDRPGKGVIWTVHPRSICAPQEMPPAANVNDPRSSCGETVNNHSSEAKASSEKTRATRLPEGWEPFAEDLATAVGLIGADRAGRELEKFTDYWRAVPGAKGRKLDWNATYRNWMRKASESHPRHDRPNRPDKTDERHENYARAWVGAGRADEVLAARRAFGSGGG